MPPLFYHNSVVRQKREGKHPRFYVVRPSRYNLPFRHATWLELFFDLIFVAVIGIAEHSLSYAFGRRLLIEHLASFIFVFIPMWWIWATYTLYSNRFDCDDHVHRLFVLLIMGLLIVFALVAEDNGETNFLYFTIDYALIRFLIALRYYRVQRGQAGRMRIAHRLSHATLIGVVISMLSILFISSPWRYAVFYIGMLFDMGAHSFILTRVKDFPVDREHLVERTGLLIIMVLGESVLNIIHALAAVPVHDAAMIWRAVGGFAMLWMLWWNFYDNYSLLARAKKITDGVSVLSSSFFTSFGLMLLATLIGHGIAGDLAAPVFRIVALVGLGSFIFGKAVPFFVCFPPLRLHDLGSGIAAFTAGAVSTLIASQTFEIWALALSLFLYSVLLQVGVPTEKLVLFLLPEPEEISN